MMSEPRVSLIVTILGSVSISSSIQNAILSYYRVCAISLADDRRRPVSTRVSDYNYRGADPEAPPVHRDYPPPATDAASLQAWLAGGQ